MSQTREMGVESPVFEVKNKLRLRAVFEREAAGT
jgi:hypothetical protein